MIRRLSGSLVGATGECPNIIVPRQGRETCRPDAPRVVYSIADSRVCCVPSADVLIKCTLLPWAGFGSTAAEGIHGRACWPAIHRAGDAVAHSQHRLTCGPRRTRA